MTQTSDPVQAAVDRYMPFLAEIRRRIYFILAVFVASSVLGFSYYEKLVRLFLQIFRLVGVNIVFTSPFQFFELAISSGLVTGLIFTLPLILYQVLSFLKPALTSKEYRVVIRLTPVSIFLFLLGFSFGVLIMKYVINLFYEKSLSLEIGNFLDVSLLLTQILVTSALMGIAFQFPIVLTLLIRLKLVEYRQLSSQRLMAYALSLIFAALLPPTDLLSLGLLTLPLVILFELTLLFNRKYRNFKIKR